MRIFCLLDMFALYFCADEGGRETGAEVGERAGRGSGTTDINFGALRPFRFLQRAAQTKAEL